MCLRSLLDFAGTSAILPACHRYRRHPYRQCYLPPPPPRATNSSSFSIFSILNVLSYNNRIGCCLLPTSSLKGKCHGAFLTTFVKNGERRPSNSHKIILEQREERNQLRQFLRDLKGTTCDLTHFENKMRELEKR